MNSLIRLSIVSLALATVSETSRAQFKEGVGVLGDSYSDEYRFYPPDRPTARNWVEILAETRGMNFGDFSLQKRPEPRNQGFDFNWARSDATTTDVLVTGQHTGLARQAASGKVKLAFVFIGGNDFINAMHSDDPLKSLDETLPRAMENYRKIVRVLRSASPDLMIVLGTVPDIRDLPEFAVPLRSGELSSHVADAYTDAIRKYNGMIRRLGFLDGKIAVADLALATAMADRVSQDCLLFAGKKLDRLRCENSPDCFFLADRRHPGTLGQALMAQLFVEVVNVKFKLGIKPLTNREILTIIEPPPSDVLAGGMPHGTNGR